MQKINSFVIPIIRDDFIETCLETLYKYTPPNFYVFVIDQTPRGLPCKYKTDQRISMYIRPYRNLGFSKAINTGIILSQTPYVTALNDDVEFISNKWWEGVEDTFKMGENIVAVNPNSPKEGAWGYGLREDNKETWIPREGFKFDGERSVVPVINGVPIDSPEIAEQHYDDLVNHHPIWGKDTLCDALACWCTVFKRDELQKIGLFDEKFYPGGGEDYDMMCRIYSQKLRAVGTTKSWVWHHWGKSKDDISGKDPHNPIFSRPRWNNLEELWGDEFDVWGHKTLLDGTKEPLKRHVPPFVDEL